MPLNVFKSNQTTVSGFLHVGTGLAGEVALSQEAIRNTLRKLVSGFGDPVVTIRVLYRARGWAPAKGILFEMTIKASQLLNSVRQTFNLQQALRGAPTSSSPAAPLGRRGAADQAHPEPSAEEAAS